MTEQKLPARPAAQPAATRYQNRKTWSTVAIWSDGCHTVWCRTLVSLLTEQYVEVLLKCLCCVKHRVVETCKVVEDQLHALLTTATDAGEWPYRNLGYITNVVYPLGTLWLLRSATDGFWRFCSVPVTYRTQIHRSSIPYDSTRCCFRGAKAAVAWRWPVTSNQVKYTHLHCIVDRHGVLIIQNTINFHLIAFALKLQISFFLDEVAALSDVTHTHTHTHTQLVWVESNKKSSFPEEMRFIVLVTV